MRDDVCNNSEKEINKKMSRGLGRVCRSYLLVLLATSLFLDVRRLCTASAIQRNSVCDDGKYMIEKDLGGEDNWKCQSEQYYTVAKFLEPAGVSQCRETVEPTDTCMETDLNYPDHPPSFGDFRPVAPKYGEYQYLPPQRWLHTLYLGGLAFLYHPCAPLEQVIKLKELANSCLWKHVVTPYPHLRQNESLAIVSWGCVYHMSWVNPPEAKLWIRKHALRTESSSVNSDGLYNQSLLHKAAAASDDVICGEPLHSDQHPSPLSPHPPPPPASGQLPGQDNSASNENTEKNSEHTTVDESPPPCKADPITCPPHSTVAPPSVTIHSPHSRTLTILIVVLSLVLFVVLLVVAWRLCSIARNHCGTKKQARYKSVSKFFPFSYGQDTASNGVAIPEYGLPKNSAAEREILLNDSDEDEL